MRSAWVSRLPQPGEQVGQYRVVGPLGQGGQGHVFLAECAGRPCVLKFFRSLPVSHSGELELDILRHLEHPNVVRVLGHGRWPRPEDGYFFLVMEHVEGKTLLRHALEHNPSARQAATLLWEAARAMAVVHRAGVLHRDVKPDNLLVRAADGKPVWVDFGVGHLEGRASPPRGLRVAPGTPEYTSPEAYRFLQQHPEAGARYQPGVADEVWAFGITAYELLTDELPFGSRLGNPRMVKDIRTRAPRAPHEDNPRVPVALGQVCLRMLEKQPRARLADMDVVASALEAALAQAGPDWDVPMMDPDDPHVRTTQLTPSKVVERDSWERLQQEMKALRPRRGRVRKARPPPAPVAPAAAVAPSPDEPPEGSFVALAEAVEARLYEPSLSVSARKAAAEPGPAALPPPAAEAGPGAAAGGSPGRGPRRTWPARAVAVAVALPLVLAGLWALRSRTDSAGVPAESSAPLAAPLPPALWAAPPTPHAAPVREVAKPGTPAQAATGAAPLVAQPSALANAMPLRKQESRSPPQEKPAPQSQAGLCRKWRCLAASCGWALVACTSGPQVRSTPGPEDCPADAVKTMEGELRLDLGDSLGADIPPGGLGRRATVRAGDAAIELAAPYGQLPEGTLLTGEYILGKDRLYGRFTRAHTPGGKTYPVCMELKQQGDGVPILDNVGSDAVKVPARVSVVPVSAFGHNY